MNTSGQFPKTRLRRLRQSHSLRKLVRETELLPNKLILPLFIRHGQQIKNPIASMPGHHQLSIDQLESELQEISRLGIKGVILFGIPATKDSIGSDSYSETGIIQS